MKLLIIPLIISLAYGGLGIGTKTSYDFELATATIRYYTPQGIGFDGQFGFVFDGGDQFLFGGSMILPTIAAKFSNLNLNGGISYFNYDREGMGPDISLLEIYFYPEVELSLSNRSFHLEFGLPLFSLAFDLENDDTIVSIFMKRSWSSPLLGCHYYF
ncbi:hypothetical protein DRP53_02390 [candidate division WOR-3 bacterium]|uniref:Uncharacterized protein n=1 Tax=candidate division WOR-3 bacterium TaxID=2052148 RepID=A0A660SK44_UNCW3|nr:MAG: hypothetical protein DRP53_02390 [candidate division WOR-3 bacterium]